MALEILYFAWVKEAIGRDGETIDPDPAIQTVGDLIVSLASLSPGHAKAFADPARIRCAVDREMRPLDAPISGAREIALFPPVTGG